MSRKADGTLGHTVYRKRTHTDRYLNKDSNHHPGQKRDIIKTLVERARRICDPEDIEKELKHLEEAFVAMYTPKVTDRIGKLLEKEKVKPVFKPTKKIQQSHGSVKDKNDLLATSGVYRIPCTCGQVYIGTTKRSIRSRIGDTNWGRIRTH
ncbi:hypothetical protein NQ315_003572 [Exocentrus adspersus]|uniref:Helix-turn-helix domain-containing protein n=1 Tax=Exocentrus adspersus TaxID=1586481 RepID=A0AAV8V9X9_9CUCU|nr:hypothetical protein NQ315_003572 [Exocentrus adspersus]